MSTRLLSLIMAVAYRQARRYGGRLWWIVLGVAWFVRRADQKLDESTKYRVRPGETLDIVVQSRRAQ